MASLAKIKILFANKYGCKGDNNKVSILQRTFVATKLLSLSLEAHQAQSTNSVATRKSNHA